MLLVKSLFGLGGRLVGSDRASARSRVNVTLKCDEDTVFLRADVFYSATESSRDEVVGGEISWNLKAVCGVDIWIPLPTGPDLEMFGSLSKKSRHG